MFTRQHYTAIAEIITQKETRGNNVGKFALSLGVRTKLANDFAASFSTGYFPKSLRRLTT